MSVEWTAQLVYVHFVDRWGYHLFDLHLKKILTGFPIPVQYTVHSVEPDENLRSINLVMSNGGGHVDIAALKDHINKLKIFGSVEVGGFGIRRIPNPSDVLAA